MFHLWPVARVRKCCVSTLDEGRHHKGIGYRSHHWNVLSAEADDGPLESGRVVSDRPPQAVLPRNIRGNAQAGEESAGQR